MNTLLSGYLGMTYDAAGNRLTETVELPIVGNAPDGSKELTYTYDSFDELIAENSAGQGHYNGEYGYNFAYDLAGNATSVRGEGSPSYNLDNQLSGPTYSGNGNPSAAAGGQSATWDAENRLTGIGSASFGYDPDGLRATQAAGGDIKSDAFDFALGVYQGGQDIAGAVDSAINGVGDYIAGDGPCGCEDIPESDPATNPDNFQSMMGRKSGREIGESGHAWEETVRAQSGGIRSLHKVEMYGKLEDQEVDSETDNELIEAKDDNSSSLDNFRNGRIRRQIRRYVALGKSLNKRPVYWFKNVPLPEIRQYLEERGITVRIGE